MSQSEKKEMDLVRETLERVNAIREKPDAQTRDETIRWLKESPRHAACFAEQHEVNELIGLLLINRKRLYFLIGRHRLDGVSEADIIERLGVRPDCAAEGWRVSCEDLSLEIARRDAQPNRLLSLEELQADAAFCIRTLLTWRERLLMEASVEPEGLTFHTNRLIRSLAQREAAKASRDEQ